MVNYTSPVPENKAWREASLMACKTDAQSHKKAGLVAIRNARNPMDIQYAAMRFEEACNRLARAQQYAAEIILENEKA